MYLSIQDPMHVTKGLRGGIEIISWSVYEPEQKWYPDLEERLENQCIWPDEVRIFAYPRVRDIGKLSPNLDNSVATATRTDIENFLLPAACLAQALVPSSLPYTFRFPVDSAC